MIKTIEKLSFKLNKKFSSEKEFTSWFGSEIKKRGGFFHKISDIDVRLKPFDALFAIDGVVGAIEFKVTTTMNGHPYRLLRGSSPKNPGPQVKGLETYQKNGGLSLVIVYNKKVNEYKVCNFLYLDFNSTLSFNA